MANVIMESPAFARHRGADHLLICPWWGAAASWGRKEMHGVRVVPEAGSIWDLLHETAILATFDEHFGQMTLAFSSLSLALCFYLLSCLPARPRVTVSASSSRKPLHLSLAFVHLLRTPLNQ